MISFKVGIKSKEEQQLPQCLHLHSINIFENTIIGCSFVLSLCLLTLKLLSTETEEEKWFYHCLRQQVLTGVCLYISNLLAEAQLKQGAILK